MGDQRSFLQMKSFEAIKEFVGCLHEQFASKKKITPLALYNRLLSHVNINSQDISTMRRFISGFNTFLSKYEIELLKEIPNFGIHAKILYSEKIYIDVFKYYKKSNENEQYNIKMHLLTIQSFLEEDEEKVNKICENLEKKSVVRPYPLKVQPSSDGTNKKEVDFVNNIFSQVSGTMQQTSSSNPAEAIGSLLSSGILQNLFSEIQGGIDSGEMNPQNLMSTLQGTLNTMMQEPAPAREQLES